MGIPPATAWAALAAQASRSGENLNKEKFAIDGGGKWVGIVKLNDYTKGYQNTGNSSHPISKGKGYF
jgi:hypothetical protein